jgi:peptidyl-prolyl cis-trans isomerase NIMA-interacting 1
MKFWMVSLALTFAKASCNPANLPPPQSTSETQEEARSGSEEDNDAGSSERRHVGPREIAARHVVVMYRGSTRAPASITRTREQALLRAQEVLERVRNGEDLGTLAQTYSDEPGADTSGGSLGRFRRGMMARPFEDAAFALEPGEISDVVESPFGFHVIQRTE